jgi:hypothetical protein
MTDIVERLHLAVEAQTHASSTLNKDAADAIEKLREENKRLQGKVSQYEKLGEPEF